VLFCHIISLAKYLSQTLSLRPRTHHPLQFNLDPNSPLILNPLITLRNLLNQCLDCVDITRWTGDRHSATFISSQLRLLHWLINEARSTLKGSSLNSTDEPWAADALSPAAFSPPLPQSVALNLTIQEASLVLALRTLEPTDVVPDIRSRFALAIGAQRRLEHDEAEQVFTFMGKEVHVREKVRVESADPCLISVMVKLGALGHTVGMARMCLSAVMGEEMEDV
jgi:Rogdi leucine zipper containing protein